jgi:hypothetical protein
VNQLAGAIRSQLGFHDLAHVSVNLLQLLRRGLSKVGFYSPLEYLGIDFVIVERK